MKKEISSPVTVGWKYVFPCLWIACMGVVTIALLLQATKGPGWIIFGLGWIIASGYLIWFARRLKFVSVDEDFLYVSQFRQQIRIPLAHVKSVKENFLGRPKLITLTLSHPSEFGAQIVFVPTALMLGGFRSHPIVEELERAIERHRSEISRGV